VTVETQQQNAACKANAGQPDVILNIAQFILALAISWKDIFESSGYLRDT
jgi:hypothetical protein